jgi:hypothetical protein
MRFEIRDWANNLMNTKAMVKHYKANIKNIPKDFKSFEDAEYFLSEVLNDQYETDRQEYEIMERK